MQAIIITSAVFGIALGAWGFERSMERRSVMLERARQGRVA